MKCRNLMKNLFTASLILIGIAVVVSLAHAHGKEKHPEEVSPHMQSMLALKERIPEELRIMERTPVEPDTRSLARGEKLYGQFCAVCHGPEGRGDGPAAAAMSPAPANFLDREHSAIYGPGEKFWIIGHGTGEGGMPPFGQIALKDRWHLVNFILHLQQKNESVPGEKKGHDH